jgi:hypothetical protein
MYSKIEKPNFFDEVQMACGKLLLWHINRETFCNCIFQKSKSTMLLIIFRAVLRRMPSMQRWAGIWSVKSYDVSAQSPFCNAYRLYCSSFLKM